jgi:AbrB family looped-hinge helix DNA binding protein
MRAKVKVGPKYQVVIPQSIRNKIPLLPKEEVLVEEINGAIIILPHLKSFTEFCLDPGSNLLIFQNLSPSRFMSAKIL